MRRIVRWSVWAALLVVMAAGVWRAGAVRAQEGLRYENYDVAIVVNEDGTFSVTSTQTIRFDDIYNTAFTEIPTDRAADVRAVQVFEQGAAGELTPLRFTVTPGDSVQTVDWEYSDTEAGEARTFVVQYTVAGGLWVYDDRDFLRWFAVNEDRAGLPVENASVTVTLPQGAAGEITAEVVSGNGSSDMLGNRVTVEVSGPLADGEGLEIEVGFPHGLVNAVVQPWQQAADLAAVEVEIPQVATTLTVQVDGRLDVTEETQVAVAQGRMAQGFRTIHLLYMDGVRDIFVMQDGTPLARGQEGCTHCFVVREEPGLYDWVRYDADSGQIVADEEAVGRVEIDWYGDPVAAGETSLITVQYAVVGGVRTGGDTQVIHLEALPDYDATTSSATLRVVLPPHVDAEAVQVESGAAMSAAETQPDGALLLRMQELPATRARWPVMITLPANATSAATPAWQAQFEQAVAAQAAAQAAAARRTLATRTGSVFAGVAAIAAGVWAWFRYGRKRVREQLRGYVAEPPSQLAPGIVAYLMDRNASERGVLASLFQLASVGLLEIDLSDGVQLRRLGTQRVSAAQSLPVTGGGALRLADHQVYLYNEVVQPNVPTDRFVTLDALAEPLRAALPETFVRMGRDAQDYFLDSSGGAPGCVAGCLTPTGLITLAVIALAGLLVSGWAPSWATLFAIGGFVFAAIMLVLALGRPFGRRRSATGEAEAAKWTRFRNYLLNLQEYGDLGAAQSILDRYFAYAVALGAENVVLAQAAQMGATLPPWVALPTQTWTNAPTSGSGSGQGGDDWPRPTTGSAPAPSPLPTMAQGAPQPASAHAPRPSLSGMSLHMGESLSGASRSMGRTLAAATGATAATVVLKSRLRDRSLEWEPGAQPTQMLDTIMRQSLRDVESVRTRPATSGPRAPGWGGPGLGGGRSGGGGSTWGGGRSSSSGGFGSRSSSSSSRSSWSSGGSSSRSSSSSSSSSSSRSSSSSSRSSSSSGGGRSGFGRK